MASNFHERKAAHGRNLSDLDEAARVEISDLAAKLEAARVVHAAIRSAAVSAYNEEAERAHVECHKRRHDRCVPLLLAFMRGPKAGTHKAAAILAEVYAEEAAAYEDAIGGKFNGHALIRLLADCLGDKARAAYGAGSSLFFAAALPSCAEHAHKALISGNVISSQACLAAFVTVAETTIGPASLASVDASPAALARWQIVAYGGSPEAVEAQLAAHRKAEDASKIAATRAHWDAIQRGDTSDPEIAEGLRHDPNYIEKARALIRRFVGDATPVTPEAPRKRQMASEDLDQIAAMRHSEGEIPHL